jgi:hypothetical protein
MFFAPICCSGCQSVEHRVNGCLPCCFFCYVSHHNTVACKVGYLLGRGDLTPHEVGELMKLPLRGEITPPEALSPPPLLSAHEEAIRGIGKQFY